MTFTETGKDGGEGQSIFSVQGKDSLPDPSHESREGHLNVVDKAIQDVPLSAFIDQLAELQVDRKFWIKSINRQTNAIGALIRLSLGWHKHLPEKEASAIKDRAARILDAAQKGKEQRPEDIEVFERHKTAIAAIDATLQIMRSSRHQIELEMARIVRKLPIYEWAKEVKGLGDRGLAVIIAEAGDLSNYPAKGHLWKRLGLAPFEGQAYSTWRMKGGLGKDDWIEAGYSPRRRAEMFAFADPLFRAQTVAQGPYRAIYDRRRAHTAETHPDWTKAHSHSDALRIMTKYLLRDLWREWNRRKARCGVSSSTRQSLPTGEQIAA